MALVVPIPVISLYITQFFYLPTEYEALFQQYINYSLISFFFFQGVLAEGSCTSYIFLHNKLLQNLVALKKTSILLYLTILWVRNLAGISWFILLFHQVTSINTTWKRTIIQLNPTAFMTYKTVKSNKMV